MTAKRIQRSYSPELRAAALADVLLLGPVATAAKYDIPRTTLQEWQQKYELVHNTATKKQHIEALAIEYLETGFQALIAQTYVISRPDYIEKQSAGELAVLHGVVADKLVRLASALQRWHPDEAADGGE